jgi:hypothetical protein
MKNILFLTMTMLLIAGSVQAVNIPVLNGDFEDRSGVEWDDAANWTLPGDGVPLASNYNYSGGYCTLEVNSGIVSADADGSDATAQGTFLFLQGPTQSATFSDVVTQALADTNYYAAVMVARPKETYAQHPVDLGIEILIDGAVVASSGPKHIINDLRASDYDMWVPLSVAYRTVTEDLGKDIRIQLVNYNGQQAFYDNATLEIQYVTAVNPEDGELVEASEFGEDLEWTVDNGWAVDVYFGTQGDPNVRNNTKLVERAVATSVSPGALEFETTYYWAVDAYEPNDVGFIVHQGPTWSFTTAPEAPVVSEDPEGVTVAIGGTAIFSITASNTNTYTWYKSPDPTNGTTGDDIETGSSNPLNLTNVQPGDEGWYYCVAANDSGSDVSDVAQLLTERMVAHWKFENNLTDEVGKDLILNPDGDWPGTKADPNFVTDGIDGNACEFFGGGDFVTITGSEEFFNFYPRGFTTVAWIKTSHKNWSGIVGKQSRPDYDAGWVTYTDGNAGVATLRGSSIYDDTHGTTTITDGQWHMVVSQFDPSDMKMKLFVDGELDAESAVEMGTIPLATTAVLIGADRLDGSWPVIGKVDDIRIYSYALTPFDLAILYTDTKPGSEACFEYPLYDYNQNCIVDLDDFTRIAFEWLECNLVPACIN